jgi:hypothetical protein
MSVVVAACGGGQPSEAPASAPAPAAAAGPTQKPYANLAQVMRAIPFTSANIIFDAQSTDPGAKPKEGAGGDSATARFSSIYSGWQQVEQSAQAISETANLLLVPGRLCENGRPVPLEVSNVVTEACLVCHEVYRDKPDNKDRCIP